MVIFDPPPNVAAAPMSAQPLASAHSQRASPAASPAMSRSPTPTARPMAQPMTISGMIWARQNYGGGGGTVPAARDAPAAQAAKGR